jgi:amino acid adenylation domain-containing protein
VIIKGTSDGDKQIIAFYSPKAGEIVEPAELKLQLQSVLPETMLPSQCIPMATLPLTVAGKIDYRSLPIESCVTRVMSSPQRNYDATPPATEMESLLHSIWCEVLKKEAVGTQANFFGLGGHSLAAAQVLARVKHALNQEVSLKEIYRYPTIASLAAWLVDQVPNVESCVILQDGATTLDQGEQESNQVLLEREPLSFAEQRLWFVDQLEPNHPFYNLPLAAKLTGVFNRAHFATAIQECVARHETLRSTYRMVQGEPQRTIHDWLEINPQYIDLTNQTKTDLHESAAYERLEKLMVASAREPFNLEQGPLLRVVVYQMSNEEHVVLLVMHHIVSDGWSMTVMLNELAEFYRAAESGEQPKLSELSVTYSQFAREQRLLAHSSSAEAAMEFWKNTLQGAIETISLPTDFDRPAVQTFEGAILPLAIDTTTSQAIGRLAAEHQTTPFTVLLAGYAALLTRYSGQSDFNIGTAIANRPRPELEALIGFFVGTLVLRMRVDAGLSFSQLVDHSQQVSLDALSHADIPFEALVERFASQRDRSHSPLFQVAFVFQNTPRDLNASSQLSIQPIAIDNGTSKYDLTLFLWEQDGRIQGHFEYRTSLFQAETIANLRDSFIELLSSAVETPSASIDALTLVSGTRRSRILQRSIAPAKQFIAPSVLHERIVSRAALIPNAIAVIEEGRQWSYREFVGRIERYAAAMQAIGLQPNQLAVVYMPRSVDQLACELAISSCGAAFVPVDTNVPPERLSSIIQETTPALIITSTFHIDDLKIRFTESRVSSCDELWSFTDATFNRVPVDSNQAAYVIFTSGSTGKPKGVVIEHHSICNFIETYSEVVEMHDGERVSHLLSPSFDGAFAETLPALSCGASLVIVPNDVSRDPARLTQFLNENQITFAVVTPVILNELEPSQLPSLKKIVSGGAKLTAEVSRKWLPRLRLFNGYGPTECTVGNAIHEIDTNFGRTPSVGRPLPNTSFYVLDANRQLVPDGVVGEVYIGGDCVGRGYWSQDALTNERFLEDPFLGDGDAFSLAPDHRPRMYRTGDLGRWNVAGELEIVGRADDQIKLRGFRIEPAEIAAVLDELPEVRSSAVVAWNDRDKGDDGTRLIAYFVPNQAIEGEQEHVDNWKVLFDESQVRSPLALRPEDNFAGWQSVITGRGIDTALMSEWAEETARRIDGIAGKRILEVGCGTGLILLRLKSDFEHYMGVDLLPSAIEQLSRTVSQRDDLVDRVTLAVRSADQLDDLPHGGFDTIVLNSVVQYFPSFEYLKRVLQSAERLLAPGGRIFLGDLRDLRLNAAFATEVETVRNEQQPITVGQLRQRIAQRLEHDEELQLDPRLFGHLAEYLPRLVTPSIRFKRGSYQNELNRYRYDAILSFDFVSSANNEAEKDRYTASPWLDREGQLRKYQLLWACLSVADEMGDALQLEQLVDEWLAEGATLAEIGRWAALKGLAITTDEVPFEQVTRDQWTNHPLARRQSLNQISRIRLQLKERLPEYMIPAAFVPMDQLPRTMQGKIDKSALPPPPAERPEWIGSYAAATDAFESQLVAIWEQLLNVSPIGVNDDFFQLGGHSMLAVRMVAEVEKRIGKPLPLAALFREPTIAQLAAQLRAPAIQGAASSLIRLNNQTQGRLLFCIHPAGGTVFCYRELGLLLEQDRPVYGLQAQGVDGRQPPHHSLIEMARYYAEAIRSVADNQEVDILGWSLGGNIAYEVARQLIASGQKVHDVILLDSGLISGDGELSDEDFLPLISALFPDQQHASLEELRKLSPQEQAAYFVEQAAKAGIVPADAEFMGAHVFSVFQANVKAVHQYEVQPLAHTLKLVRPLDQVKTGALFEDQNLGWEPWVNAVELSTVPGDHAGMLSGDAVIRLADQLR